MADKHKTEAQQPEKGDKPTYEKLLEIAEDRRTLELTLFWQRSAFFWGFTTLAFGGYAYLFSTANYPVALFIACFGFLSAVIWTMVNRGGKFWHEYWEVEVQNRTDEYFKDANQFEKDEKYRFNPLHVFDGLRYSPSKMAIALSDYMTISWFFILLGNLAVISNMSTADSLIQGYGRLFVLFTVLYLILVGIEARRHPKKGVKKDKITQSPPTHSQQS
jgi:hypothetical protein